MKKNIKKYRPKESCHLIIDLKASATPNIIQPISICILKSKLTTDETL